LVAVHTVKMKIVKDYVDYLKDNPKGYWFKRKLYGWGWTPATKEGLFLLALFLFSIFYIVFTKTEDLLLEVLIVTSLFLFVIYIKGEPPKWQWGIDKTIDKE